MVEWVCFDFDQQVSNRQEVAVKLLSNTETQQIRLQVPHKLQSQQLDPADDQAMNSRLSIRQQKMHGTQGCYGEHVELTVDDIWQITNVGDQELGRPALLQYAAIMLTRWRLQLLTSVDLDDHPSRLVTVGTVPSAPLLWLGFGRYRYDVDTRYLDTWRWSIPDTYYRYTVMIDRKNP